MKKEREIAICKDCGKEIIGSYVEYDGEYICQECFDNDYFYCDDCGRIGYRDYGYWIESSDRVVCDCCICNYNRCEDCGEYYPENETTTINDGNNNYYEVCEHCYSNNNYGYCDGCGEYFEEGCLHWHDDDCYCDNCYSEQSGYLYDYHEFIDWHLFKGINEENPPYYIGKEIELEPKGSSDVRGVLNAIENNINAVGMHDGSLSYGGVEVVTHPESWEYLQEHKQDYINFFNKIKDLEYGNAGGCGLHFHVTRPNEDVIARVIMLLESFKSEIKKLSRRSENQLSSWAKFLTDFDGEEKIKYQSSKYLKDTYIKGWHDRYLALNLNNSNTIEFRFFNGVNTFEQFWGALQFIHNVMQVALNEEKDINTINWQDLLQGEELREQARKRDVLSIDKKAKDTTEILEKLEKQKEELKKKIKNTLNNMVKYIYKELEESKLEDIQRKDIDNIKENASQYVRKLTDKLIGINDVVGFYRSVDNYNLNMIKNETNMLKRTTQGKYERYFKQIEKLISDYESEVR